MSLATLVGMGVSLSVKDSVKTSTICNPIDIQELEPSKTPNTLEQ